MNPGTLNAQWEDNLSSGAEGVDAREGKSQPRPSASTAEKC